MTDELSPLRAFYGDRIERMEDLKRYFAKIATGQFTGHSRTAGLNLLAPASVAKQTTEFRNFHPLVRELDLLLLDDPNTSDYHCYVPDLPSPGTVLFMSHDGHQPEIVFSSLDELLAAANQARESGIWLEELHQKLTTRCLAQERIDGLIKQLFDENVEEAEGVLHFLINHSNLNLIDVFVEIASDLDFDFGETIANRILEIPSMSLLPIANACTKNPSRNVAEAGERAVAAINSNCG